MFDRVKKTIEKKKKFFLFVEKFSHNIDRRNIVQRVENSFSIRRRSRGNSGAIVKRIFHFLKLFESRVPPLNEKFYRLLADRRVIHARIERRQRSGRAIARNGPRRETRASEGDSGSEGETKQRREILKIAPADLRPLRTIIRARVAGVLR